MMIAVPVSWHMGSTPPALSLRYGVRSGPSGNSGVCRYDGVMAVGAFMIILNQNRSPDEPTGRREAPPDDRLREIRDSTRLYPPGSLRSSGLHAIYPAP